MSWSTFDRLDAFEPIGKPRFGLIFLHPFDGTTLRENPVFTRLLEKHKFACLCPIAPGSWWVKDAERVILDEILPQLASRWNLPSRSVGLFGVGMGGQGALRLAFKNPAIFQVAAGIASALDFHDCYGYGLALDDLYDSRESARQDTALMHLPPYDAPQHIFFCVDAEDPEWVRGNDRLHEKLNALGVEHTHDLGNVTGLRGWDYANAQAERVVQFLFDALVQRGRRLM